MGHSLYGISSTCRCLGKAEERYSIQNVSFFEMDIYE